MPASDLFKDAEDVRFRLLATHLMVGNMPCTVRNVIPTHDMKAETSLIELVGRGGAKLLTLKQLPLSAMYKCPTGYIDGYWVSRGPCRTRHQGIIEGSLWGVNEYGDTRTGFNEILSDLHRLAVQPRRKTKNFRKGSPITNEVLVTKNDYVLYRGSYVGDYISPGVLKLGVEPSERLVTALDNSSLKIKG